jgi:hypothetical protein
MGTLASLRKNLLDMSFDEKIALIRRNREERKIQSPEREKVTRAARVKNMDKLTKALAGLSPEELAILQAELLKP